MKNFLRSFYAKIAAVFLVLLVILGTAQLIITYHSSMKLISAANQQLNLNLAKHIADSYLEPVLARDAPEKKINSSLHYLMVYNPRIEIYVLDKNGRIINYFAKPDVVKLQKVPLKPIKKFVSESYKGLIVGKDPRNPDKTKPFSATTINLGGGQSGYLYIILSSEQYNSKLNMIQNSYIVSNSLKVLGIILGLTAIAGLTVFWLLTRRLRNREKKLKAFEAGDYSVRMDVDSPDELGRLASSFNHMAATIQSNVKELEKTDQLRRNLVANISHDLRSPLASIQGYLETILLKNDDISPQRRRKYLQVIMDNTKSLRNLVEQLFELSKLDARQVEPKPEPFSIAELVQDVIIKLKPHATENDVSISANLLSNISQVYADIGLIERVIKNLLENAINYTGTKGKVEVGLQQKGDDITVQITDNGPGIAEEDIPHIFDRFHRGDKSRSLDKNKAGLGLAIAQKILELHETEISVESEKGKGTQFRFDLPVYQPAGANNSS